MNARVLRLTVIAAMALLLTGCPFPPPQSLKLGTWLFEIEGQPNVLILVKLSAGGLAEDIIPPPPPATAFFGGTLMWEQDRYEFTMIQDLGFAKVRYTGVVLSNSEMAGSFGAGNTQWTANFFE